MVSAGLCKPVIVISRLIEHAPGGTSDAARGNLERLRALLASDRSANAEALKVREREAAEHALAHLEWQRMKEELENRIVNLKRRHAGQQAAWRCERGELLDQLALGTIATQEDEPRAGEPLPARTDAQAGFEGEPCAGEPAPARADAQACRECKPCEDEPRACDPGPAHADAHGPRACLEGEPRAGDPGPAHTEAHGRREGDPRAGDPEPAHAYAHARREGEPRACAPEPTHTDAHGHQEVNPHGSDLGYLEDAFNTARVAADNLVTRMHAIDFDDVEAALVTEFIQAVRRVAWADTADERKLKAGVLALECRIRDEELCVVDCSDVLMLHGLFELALIPHELDGLCSA